MKHWLKTRLAELDTVPDDVAGEYLAGVVAEAERRAAAAGLPDVVAACQIRPGVVGVELARRVLSECLGACQQYADKPDDGLLDSNQAAAYLNRKPSGVRKLCKRGDLRFTRAGERGHFQFKREWLDEFLTGGPAPPERKRRAKLPGNQFGFDPDLLKI